MKAIIRWEQLNEKPFSRLNYNSEDDIISLFYTCSLSDQIHISLDEFKKRLTENSTKRMIREFEKQTSHLSQFQVASKKKEESDSEPSDPIYIKSIIAKLVMSGLDAYFALNKMELCDLPIFQEAYDQNTKDNLEFSRLWAFIQVSPHLSKEIKKPMDLFQFPWEATKRTIPKADLEESKDIFKLFMKSTPKA